MGKRNARQRLAHTKRLKTLKDCNNASVPQISILNLPHDCLGTIFQFLTQKQMAQMRLVCTMFNQVCLESYHHLVLQQHICSLEHVCHLLKIFTGIQSLSLIGYHDHLLPDDLVDALFGPGIKQLCFYRDRRLVTFEKQMQMWPRLASDAHCDFRYYPPLKAPSEAGLVKITNALLAAITYRSLGDLDAISIPCTDVCDMNMFCLTGMFPVSFLERIAPQRAEAFPTVNGHICFTSANFPQSLREVNVRSTLVTDVGITCLARACHQIEVLDVSHLSVGDVALDEIGMPIM